MAHYISTAPVRAFPIKPLNSLAGERLPEFSFKNPKRSISYKCCVY